MGESSDNVVDERDGQLLVADLCELEQDAADDAECRQPDRRHAVHAQSEGHRRDTLSNVFCRIQLQHHHQLSIEAQKRELRLLKDCLRLLNRQTHHDIFGEYCIMVIRQ